jgi:23S rRNA pseudouridine1911/1915/1917 synthase
MVGLRADKAISFCPEVGSRNRAESLLDRSLVRINGKIPKSSQKIKPGDQLEILVPDETQTDIAPLDLKLDILFEDQDLLVVNKPSGLVVHPAAGHHGDTLVNALLSHTTELSMKFGEKRPGIVHRLDKETSGVLVVAKNDSAHELLTQQFKNRTIHRIYFAACFGCPKVKTGVIQSYLARHPTNRKRFASVLDFQKKIIRDPNAPPSIGKWAVTHLTVLENLKNELSYLQLKLETGRTHQIRIHLSEIGCPILGDDLYGAQRKIKTISSSGNRDKISTLPRFALHAAELGFEHPRTKKQLMFKVPWPDDLRSRLISLGFQEIK